MNDGEYSVPKLDIGKGHVFWSDDGRQIRIFGPETSMRGPVSLMEKVAMRIVHLIDRHGGYFEESDGRCEKCRSVRAFRKHFGSSFAMTQETVDQEFPKSGA